MNLKHLLASVGVAAASLTISGASAQAFSFTTNLSAGSNAPKGDIILQSVSFGNQTVSNFSFVKAANILANDLWSGGNTGAASVDRGDNATGGKREVATNETVVKALGNSNLNNIIDTEDSGSFKMNLLFESAVSNLLFWERGMNSRIGVQAIDSAGNVIGNFLKLDSRAWQYAGFGIDTTEIDGAQRVGSLGVSLADLGVTGPVAGIQLTSESSFNGPDFKVVGTSAAVPEPTAMAGLAIAGAGMAAARRRARKA